MAGVTSPYGLPYQEVGDSPNGAVGLQNLAEAVDDALAVIDAKIATINAFDPAFASSSTDEAFSSASFVAGTVAVGVAFTAPTSGKVIVNFSGHISSDVNGNAVLLSFEMKTGGTVGSGTLVGTAANSDRAIVCGRAVNAGAVAQVSAGNWALYTGLTAGATYNVRMMHAADPGNASHAFYRQICVIPHL